MNNNELKIPFNVTNASKETIEFLIKIGILYIGEDGKIHVVEEK